MPSAHGSRHPAEAASAWIHRRSCGRSIVDLCGGVLVDTPDRAPVLSGSSIAGSAVGPGLGRGQAAAGRGSCRAWWNSSLQAGFPGPVRGTCSSCRCFEPPRPRYPTRRRALPANKYRPGGIPLAGGSALLHMTFPQVAPGPILMVPRRGCEPAQVYPDRRAWRPRCRHHAATPSPLMTTLLTRSTMSGAPDFLPMKDRQLSAKLSEIAPHNSGYRRTSMDKKLAVNCGNELFRALRTLLYTEAVTSNVISRGA
jgi:hypothetical protein